MQNTTAKLLFLLIVTGALFVGCTSDKDDALETDANGSLEESVMGGLEENGADDETQVDDPEQSDDSDEDDAVPTSGGPGAVPGSDSGVESSAYKDGTYSSEGAYQSPAGKEVIGVSLVIEGGVVTAVTVTPKADDPTSAQFQELFGEGVSAMIVGKSLDSLGSLGAVNGASLTPVGFNSAAATIKTLAQS